MEGANLAVRQLEALEELGVDQGGRGLDELVGHAEGRGARAVEPLAVGAHGRVAVVAHVVDDGLGARHDLLGQGARALDVRVGEGAAARQVYVNHELLLLEGLADMTASPGLSQRPGPMPPAYSSFCTPAARRSASSRMRASQR